MGNGRAAAIVFAREGARLCLTDVNRAAAEETAHLVRENGGEAIVCEADVSVSGDCGEVVDACMSAFGRIDVLHNNVGIEIPGGLEDTSEQDWERTFSVNLKGMFLMCKQTIPQMKSQRSGSIINISSINAIRTLPALSLAYAASKAGVIAMTREIAIEYAAEGIRANSILPGMMTTPFVVASLTAAYGGSVEEMMKYRDEQCPMGKQGSSWDVANLALFLASDEAKYLSGESVIVDGAQTCRM